MVDVRAVVGGGYDAFWAFRGRYRVVKGGRASKKSKTTALNFIVRMMRYPDANLLVVRKVFRTLKDSCYAELKWAIGRLGVSAFWDCRESPLELVYRPTGQKILFRGLDDAMKITSITVNVGQLCWLWVEEAYELGCEADFNLLDESIRGHVEPPLFKQVTLTFNPWHARHWLKARFFDPPPSADLLALTTTYADNEFLDAADKRLFDDMKTRDPARWRVAACGEWGAAEGLVFHNLRLQSLDDALVNGLERRLHGLDWGYFPDPTAYVGCHYDASRRVLTVFDEWVQTRASAREVYDALTTRGVLHDEPLICDNSDRRSIADLRELGLYGALAASKGPGSLRYSMQWLQGLAAIVIDPLRTPKTAAEMSQYEYQKDAEGGYEPGYPDRDNHCIDAVRYACNGVWRNGMA